jgi:hypothetical protein
MKLCSERPEIDLLRQNSSEFRTSQGRVQCRERGPEGEKTAIDQLQKP